MFPHMMPEDTPVWQRWLATHANDWVDVQYDVHVGTPIELHSEFEEPYRGDSERLSQKRIDVVLIYPDKHIVIEVKKLADWKAIGQVMGYPVLYERDIHPGVDIIPLLITETFTRETQFIMDHYKLPYDIVPPPEEAEPPVRPLGT